MLHLMYYCLLILGLSFLYSNAEPIKGNNVFTAEEHEYPFIAGIIDKTGYVNAEQNHFCTGVLISKNLVLTANHCFSNRFLDRIQIVLGSIDLRNGTRYNVNSGINYTEWAKSKGVSKIPLINDIGIIKLSEDVDERVAIPAKLSSKKLFNLCSYEKVTIVGWGRTNLKPDKSSRYLQKASLIIPTVKKCQNELSHLLNEGIVLKDNIFCTKAKPSTFIGCGDSGGPILNKKKKVVGINIGTCPKPEILQPNQRNNRVNLHTNVHYYKTFIQDVLMNY